MKHPDHIMKAIDLLQNAKVKNPLPWWLVPLDYFLASALYISFFGGIAFLIYKLISWL
jgi:hypothetical protein